MKKLEVKQKPEIAPVGKGIETAEMNDTELDEVSGGIITVLLNPVAVAGSKNLTFNHPPSPCLPQH